MNKYLVALALTLTGCLPKNILTRSSLENTCIALTQRIDIKDLHREDKAASCRAYLGLESYRLSSMTVLLQLNASYAALTSGSFKEIIEGSGTKYEEGKYPCSVVQEGIIRAVGKLEGDLPKEEEKLENQHPKLLGSKEYVEMKYRFHANLRDLKIRILDYKCPAEPKETPKTIPQSGTLSYDFSIALNRI
ncbi:hypothetical protein HYU23_04720 [Candidatus Woesearchaeota archaeon]|nr:hypothetical protein [Candidatus Woesearchaeota archaeon]